MILTKQFPSKARTVKQSNSSVKGEGELATEVKMCIRCCSSPQKHLDWERKRLLGKELASLVLTSSLGEENTEQI